MLALWCAVMVSQAPATNDAPVVAILPVMRKELIRPTLAEDVEAMVRQALIERHLEVIAPAKLKERLGGFSPESCENNRPCLSALGKIAGAWAVVRIAGATLDEDLSVALDARTADGVPLFAGSPVVKVKNARTELPQALVALGDAMSAAMPKTQRKPDAPVAAQLVPKPVAAPPVVLVAPRSRPVAAPLALGGGALVAAGVGAGFLASALSAHSCLNGPALNGQPTVCVPQSQVSAVQSRADTGLAVGVASSAVALALAATAVLVFESN
ncbi:MAG: hypothetical protein QM723_30340 [Myxococcaceae bacterium]